MIAGSVLKADKRRGLVSGYASVSLDADGEILTDLQGDQIEPDDLMDAAVDFMLNCRETGIMHEGETVGTVVEALVTHPATLQAMGIPANAAKRVPLGLFITVKVPPDVLKRVESGELRAFSIQGTGTRELVA